MHEMVVMADFGTSSLYQSVSWLSCHIQVPIHARDVFLKVRISETCKHKNLIHNR